MATAQENHSPMKVHGSSGPAGTHVKQYDNLKTLLKNAKSTSGNDLYSHLQEVFKKLILHYPDQAFDKLEEVSYLLKNQDKVKLTDYLVIEETKNYDNLAREFQSYYQKFGAYYRKSKPEGQQDEENEEEAAQEEEVAAVGFVSDLINDMKVYEWAGIGFGEIETYRIMKALKKLATESGAGNIRFFGKINGTQFDYYVAEGSLEGGDDEENAPERPPEFEPRGTGVNKFVYWVTTNILDKWTKLPDLLPSDINAARQIKVNFSGNLERQIYTNPFFFGQEKHYLRAQIARISQSTTIIPKGLFKIVEDNDREVEEFVPEEGELQMPSTHEMANANNWVHYVPNILQSGRTAHMDQEVPEGAPEEVTPESMMADLIQSDPYDKRLKPITEDSLITVAEKSKQQAWVVKLMGDKNVYQSLMDPKKKVSYGVVVVRSLQWPGSYTFYSQGRYLSIYVGGGHKYETQSYFPVHPPKIMEDNVELYEQPEPTPLYEEPVPQQEENQEEGEEQEQQDEY